MENKHVTYSYSSAENDEIRKIRQKYEPKQEEKSLKEKVIKLDKSVNNAAFAISITAGIIGALIFGTGLSMILLVPDEKIIEGLIFGIAGIIVMISAYPLKKYITLKKRKKIAPQIMELTDKILK